MEFYDVIIIGSGPSGLMCACQIRNKEVLLLEKNEVIGGKLKVSGGGRCNVTNSKSIDGLLENIPCNAKFLYPSLNSFSSKDIIKFFESNGCELKEEDNNRMFPITNSSQTIIDTFTKVLKKNGIKIRTGFSVDRIEIINGEYIVNDYYKCRSVVIATGGKTYPHLGTTGDGYLLLENLGHKITDLMPTETPLVSNDEIIQNKLFQGITLKNTTVELLINNKSKKKMTGDLLFTHFGISGPLGLQLSYYCQKALKNNKKIALKIHLTTDVPKKIKAYTDEPFLIININDTKGWKVAFVTSGGLSLKEVMPNNFESKIHSNLFVIGELLDINAHTGGYNLTSCMSEGYSVAKYINNMV
jgi:predicted Rossmann fold flavoprotein